MKREVTRIVTPGTAMDANLVRSRENNYLAAVARADGRSAVAHVDVSTGEFRVTEMEPAEVAGALEQLGAREVLFPGDLPLLAGADRAGPRFVRTEIEEWVFSADYAERTLRDHFQLLSLDGCGLANRPAAVGAAGAVLHYLRDTQRAALDHLDRPTFYDRADSMVLDAVTVRNLELRRADLRRRCLRAADAGHGAGRARPDADRDGRAPAAPAAAAALDRSRRDRAAARCRRRTAAADHPARRAAQAAGDAFSTWSGCWPR